ncbi:MAG: HAD family hydrolase [Nitrospirae bacterium]|nr:HAD family hydrolase [Nitrospirota bacterium]
MNTIIFDFDGVILESVDVKGWAFAKLFENYPEHVKAIVDFHYANPGVSRFDKFSIIYKDILKIHLTDEIFNILCDDFSKIVFDKVITSDFVPGAKEFINEFYKTINLFIVSATPHNEIIDIVQQKNLTRYFKNVYGSPLSKIYWTKKIMEVYNINPNDILFVGDATSDYEAAKENNIAFIARIKEGYDVFAGKDVVTKVKNLFELKKYIVDNYILF